jgi:hypothetical protein
LDRTQRGAEVAEDRGEDKSFNAKDSKSAKQELDSLMDHFHGQSVIEAWN